LADCTDRLFGRDGAVGLDLHHQLVEVGALLDAGVLDGVADAATGENEASSTMRPIALGGLVAIAAHVARHVAAALLDLDLHVELAALRQVGNDVLGVDDLDVVRRLDVGRRDRALAFLAQHQRDFVAVVQPEDHALEVQHDVDDVFLHAVDGRVLVQHAGDRHFGRRIAHHRRQQHAAQRVAQRVAVAALERLERALARWPPSGSTWMALGLRRLVCIESLFPVNTLGSLHR
jgi:hypothetical protein